MDKAFEHVGIYDFWCVFGAGIVVMTSGILFLFIPFQNEIMRIVCNLKEIELTMLIFYIITCYILGLILQYISSIVIKIKKIGLNIKSASNAALSQEGKNRIVKFSYNLRKKYIAPHFTHNDIDNNCESQKFDNCNSYLKTNKLTSRADKYHSIYGMSRSMALGYAILSLVNFLVMISKAITKGFSVDCIYFLGVGCLFSFLTWLMFLRTKEYYYRWIGWVFTEYEYAIKKEGSNS